MLLKEFVFLEKIPAHSQCFRRPRGQNLKSGAAFCVLEVNFDLELKRKVAKNIDDTVSCTRKLSHFPIAVPPVDKLSAPCSSDILLGYDLDFHSEIPGSLPDYLLSHLGLVDDLYTPIEEESSKIAHVRGSLLTARQRRVSARKSRESTENSEPCTRSTPDTAMESKVGKSLFHISKDHFLSCIKETVNSRLLTKEQEISLSKKFKAALMVESKRKLLRKKFGKPFNDLELATQLGLPVTRLSSILLEGSNAREMLINSNLRLVISVSRQFTSRGLPQEDLVQFGMLGLIRGIEKFDHTKGFRLSTYVHWWIRQSMNRALANHSRTIRLPVHVQEGLHKLYKARQSLEVNRMGESIKELAVAVGLSEQKVRRILKARIRTYSMDMPFRSSRSKEVDGTASLHHFVADPGADNGWQNCQLDFTKSEFHKLIAKLMPREQEIIRAHYGLGDHGIALSLEEVSKRHGISRERTRQIENVALHRLKVICQEENFVEILRNT